MGKVLIGSKLAICDSRMNGCEDGIDPLDKSFVKFPFKSDMSCPVSFQIHANATRLARWDAKLGFSKATRCMQISLPSVIPSGGTLPCIELLILRKYPLCFWEKMSSGLDASEVKYRMLSESEESNAQVEYAKLRQKQIEKLAEECEASNIKVCNGLGFPYFYIL